LTEKAFLLKEGERLDDLQRNGYHLIQNPAQFCFGMDAVLLSGFVTAKRGDQILDLGTGTGILPLLIAAKTPADHITGLEIQEESADMARRSIQGNGLTERISIVMGDIKEADRLFSAASFHVITSNPPYMKAGHALHNPCSPKAIARHEILCTMEDVVAAAAKLLLPGGTLYMVHRPFRLPELIATLLRHRLEPKRMRLVYPHRTDEANLVLLSAVRGGKAQLRMERPLILMKDDGTYMEEVIEDYCF
jgi:tRNA1Val (adenine37-N6)-methyltransferase